MNKKNLLFYIILSFIAFDCAAHASFLHRIFTSHYKQKGPQSRRTQRSYFKSKIHLDSIKALFSSKHDISGIIRSFIKNEKKQIRIAIYAFTDWKIAAELVNAKKRGIDVKILADKLSSESKYSQVPYLKKNGISVHTLDNFVIHHKAALFFDNNYCQKTSDRSYLLNGSANFSVAAQQANKENICIIQSKSAFQDFLDEFERLEKHARKL